jgi:hypothetical protein
MPDERISGMDNQFGTRSLLWTLGGLLLAVGGQPLLTYFSGGLSLKTAIPSLLTVLSGLSFLGLAFFWRPKEGSRSAPLFDRLGRWGSSPVPYALVILLIWVYFETLAVERNIELAALRNDQYSIGQVLNPFVLPRQLSARQADSISGYLKQFSSVIFSFDIVKNDDEAGRYAEALRKALEDGGWHLRENQPYTYVDETPNGGLAVGFRQTPEHNQNSGDYRNPKSDVILQEAFGLAGVRLDGGNGGVADSTVSQDEIKIIVGHRGKDYYALP